MRPTFCIQDANGFWMCPSAERSTFQFQASFYANPKKTKCRQGNVRRLQEKKNSSNHFFPSTFNFMLVMMVWLLWCWQWKDGNEGNEVMMMIWWLMIHHDEDQKTMLMLVSSPYPSSHLFGNCPPTSLSSPEATLGSQPGKMAPPRGLVVACSGYHHSNSIIMILLWWIKLVCINIHGHGP